MKTKVKNMFKNKHVLIIGAGYSLKRYWDRISKFIEENDLITIGCNYVDNLLVPDYNLWASFYRWGKYGRYINRKANLYFAPVFSKKRIQEYWRGSYQYYDTDDPLLGGKKYKTVYNCFKHVGAISIVWAYQGGSFKISIVGMDGYTYYTKKQLKSKEYSQHSDGMGKTVGRSYGFGTKQDKFIHKKLKKLYRYSKKKYGFGFEILTPTIHTKYYNSKILGIKEKYKGENIFK